MPEIEESNSQDVEAIVLFLPYHCIEIIGDSGGEG